MAATLSNEIEQSANVRGQLLIAHKTLLNQQAKIAELESRTVKLPEPFKLAKSSSGLTYYYADEVNEALTAEGIKWEAE
ncbi:TPA: hypothetical protein SMK42_001484 [Klebsiella michiganensis]|nr:hypothetical protein [Klebsiella michiganensis]